MNRIKETAVRARLKAREWRPYPPEDKALDVAALLASGDFSSVKASEVDLTSSAFRLDLELLEASLPVHVSTQPEPGLSESSPPPPPLPIPAPTASAATWSPRPAKPAGPPGTLEPPWAVLDIAVQGNRHVKYSVIRSQTKARKGTLYQKMELEQDIQSLLALGNFERVAVDLSPLPDQPLPPRLAEASGSTTAVRLTFLVEEKPLIRRIRFAGQKKVSKGKLSDALTLKEKDPLDRTKLREDTGKIQELYLERGYLGAGVEPQVSVDSAAAMADIVFRIAEGPRSLIHEVRLEGLTAFKPRKLLKRLTNRRKKVYQESKLEEDLRKIEDHYKNSGYLDFKISSRTVGFSEDRSRVTISLALEEGRVYRFGSTRFTGHSVYASTELARVVEYRRGRIFNQEKFEQTVRGIQELYADKGYLRAKVSPEKTHNPSTGQMDVALDITEGSIVYVDHVDVEGNTATKTHVLKREIVIKRGQPFSAAKIRKSQDKILNLGFIDDVRPDIQASPTDPDKADLTFEVVEGKPGMFTAGAGFSSLDGLLGTLSLQHLNFFGRAQRVSAAWSFGARVQDYSVSWLTPWVGDSPTSLGFEVFNTRRIRPFDISSSGFVEKRQGGTVRVGPRFEDDKYQLNLNYGFQKVGVTNIQTQFLNRLSESTSIQSTFGAELARDTRDNIWDPSRGTRHSIGMSLAGGPLLRGDIHFWKPYISDSLHLHLASIGDYPLVLSFSNRASYATPFNETREVPVFERFFLGGQDTLRGYSPSGEVGAPNGGKVYDVFNMELGFPLARERKKTIVKLVGFFDAGTAWENMRSVRFRVGTTERDIKTDVGIGLRFVTPAFPIRLDYGYGLNHRPGERLYQINFGIGPLF